MYINMYKACMLHYVFITFYNVHLMTSVRTSIGPEASSAAASKPRHHHSRRSAWPTHWSPASGKHRKTIGKPWENHRKTIGKWWFK